MDCFKTNKFAHCFKHGMDLIISYLWVLISHYRGNDWGLANSKSCPPAPPSVRGQKSIPDPKTLQIQRDGMNKGWGKGTAGTDEHAIRCLQISCSLCGVCSCVISVGSSSEGDRYLKKLEEGSCSKQPNSKDERKLSQNWCREQPGDTVRVRPCPSKCCTLHWNVWAMLGLSNLVFSLMGNHLPSKVLCSKSLFSANHWRSVVTVALVQEPFLVTSVILFLKFNAKNPPSGIVPRGR